MDNEQQSHRVQDKPFETQYDRWKRENADRILPDEATKVPLGFCPHCGSSLRQGAIFCSKCGKEVTPKQDIQKTCNYIGSPLPVAPAVVNHNAQASQLQEKPFETQYDRWKRENADRILPDEATKMPLGFCPHCGSSLRQGAIFCSKCGKEITSKQPVPTSSNQCVAAVSPQLVSSQNANTEEKPSKEYLRSLIEEAENGKSNGTKSLVVGIVMVVIWMICFFTPAIWTNFLFLIIVGPISIVFGIVGITSNSSKIERYTRELRQY